MANQKLSKQTRNGYFHCVYLQSACLQPSVFINVIKHSFQETHEPLNLTYLPDTPSPHCPQPLAHSKLGEMWPEESQTISCDVIQPAQLLHSNSANSFKHSILLLQLLKIPCNIIILMGMQKDNCFQRKVSPLFHVHLASRNGTRALEQQKYASMCLQLSFIYKDRP